jgi:tripartite-type tricarboxylate transporter receptor subunit TctC
MRFRLSGLVALGLFALALPAATARAQDYPTRPVRWVVPYPPGGTTDVLARLIGEYLSRKMGQQFFIDNRPGAGNNIGTDAVVKAAPDGYTVLLVNPANGINASLYKSLPFNFIRDIAPVGGFVRVPNVMEVNPRLPGEDRRRVHRLRQGQPGQDQHGLVGPRHLVHLSGELFMAMTGVEDDPRALPRRGAGAHRPHLRAGPCAVRQPALFGGVHPRR